MARRDASRLIFRHRALLLVAAVATWVVPLVPLRLLYYVGGCMGLFLTVVPLGNRHRRVRDHLAACYPEMSPRQRKRVFRQSYRGLARYVLDSLWIPAWKPERDDRRVSVETPEAWQRMLDLARERGRGLVIYTAHLGSPEILGCWLSGRAEGEILVVAAQPNLDAMVEILRKWRERTRVKVIYRGNAGVATMRHLLRGGVVVMFADHNVRGAGVAVPFFGYPAHTLLAPARLALQSGAVANTVFGVSDGPGRYRVFCDEPMVLPDYPKDLQERFLAECRLTVDYTRRIEVAVRRYPGQYLWMHRRWRERGETRPLPPELS